MFRSFLYISISIMFLIFATELQLFARDYNSDATEIKSSVNVNSLVTEEKAVENLESYQGASAAESNYYSGGDMEADALLQSGDNSSAQVLDDVLNSSPNYTVNPNEDWLQNAKNISDHPEDSLTLISSNYDDCGKAFRSCNFYQGITNEYCQANRIVEVDSYHKYQCFKNRYSYDISCDNILNLSCASSHYTLPPVSTNSFPVFNFSGTTLTLGAGWRGGNCAGYNFDFKFNIPNPSVVESFILKNVVFDDRILVYINGNLVYHPIRGGCELYRVFRFSPNINLKSHLVSGTNHIKIKLIIGGAGMLSAVFDFKYKECGSYASNNWVKQCDSKIFEQDQCIETENICIEGPESRNIGQGVSEYRSCWKYGIKQQCIPSEYINNCQDLEEISDCTQNTSECLEYGDDYCLKYQNGYKCKSNDVTQIENKVIYDGFFQDIISDYIDYSNCDSFSQSSSCSLTQEICTNTGRKNIDGLIINKECWDYDRTYSCSSQSPNLSDCATLENSCVFDSQECVDQNSDNICTKYKRNYECNTIGSTSSDADISICGSQVYCADGNCDEIDYERDKNFANAAANLAVLDEAAQDLVTVDSTTFTGSNNKCGKDLINYSDCCKVSGWGEVIGASCSSEEQDLQDKRRNKLCVYVGEYCAQEHPLTGICLKEKQSYCCFNSKIARIVHEQGRPQLGINWGSASSPNCSGFPVTRLDDIDFTQIDFSEISSDITSNAQSNSMTSQEISEIVSQKVQDYYNQNQGGNNE